MVERALILHQSHDENKPLRFASLIEDQPDDTMRPAVQEETHPQLSLDAAMRRHIEAVLRKTGGRIQGRDGAAAILGIHSSTLRSRMDKLGVTFGRKAR